MPVKIISIKLLDNGSYLVNFSRKGESYLYGLPSWKAVSDWIKDHVVES